MVEQRQYVEAVNKIAANWLRTIQYEATWDSLDELRNEINECFRNLKNVIDGVISEHPGRIPSVVFQGRKILSLSTWEKLLNAFDTRFTNQDVTSDAFEQARRYLGAIVDDVYRPHGNPLDEQPQFTIYFDTSFYAWIGRENESTRASVARELDDLGIRPVLSRTLHFELGKETGFEASNFEIFSFVQRLKFEAYRTESFLWWDFLVLPQEFARGSQNSLLELGNLSSTAQALSHVADMKLKKSERERILTHHKDVYRSTDVEDSRLDEKNFTDAPGMILKNLKKQIESHGGIDASFIDEIDLENFNIEAVMRRHFGSAWERINNEAEFRKSTVGASPAPIEIALGTASEKRKDRFNHDRHDAGHMSEFFVHRNEIDLLQIDTNQKNKMSAHPLHKARLENLAERCFAPANLEEALAMIKTWVNTRT